MEPEQEAEQGAKRTECRKEYWLDAAIGDFDNNLIERQQNGESSQRCCTKEVYFCLTAHRGDKTAATTDCQSRLPPPIIHFPSGQKA